MNTSCPSDPHSARFCLPRLPPPSTACLCHSRPNLSGEPFLSIITVDSRTETSILTWTYQSRLPQYGASVSVLEGRKGLGGEGEGQVTRFLDRLGFRASCPRRLSDPIRTPHRRHRSGGPGRDHSLKGLKAAPARSKESRQHHVAL